MLPKDPAPPICRRFHMRPNILWPSERPREQPHVSCPSVHMCEPNESLLPVQMTGSMCAVMGPSAQSGFGLKNTHLVWLCRLALAQLAAALAGAVLHLEEADLAPRISNASEAKKITRSPRRAYPYGAASSRAATRSRSFHPASLLLPSWLSKPVYGGKGEDVAPGASPRGIKGPQAPCRSAALARPSQTYP